jgi:DNA-binding NtrC family response regulator
MSESSLLDGKKILAVDDEPDILEALEEILSMCEVVKASTFEEAKDLLESRDFDMAILDIMGVDGYGLLDIANRRNITAVMLTAHAFTPDNLVKSIKEGAASYLPKEELANIATFLNDVLEAKKKGENTWGQWQERLPTSFFEKRWGAAWQDTDKEFWERFRAGIKARGSQSKKTD